MPSGPVVRRGRAASAYSPAMALKVMSALGTSSTVTHQVTLASPLAGMVTELLAAVSGVHVLRDPTRGGLATALNEIARQSQVEIEIEESAVPVRESVAAACEMLGLDPLYAANEGKMIVVVAEEGAEVALETLRAHPLGAEAAAVGRVDEAREGRVLLKTALGTLRILDRHVGGEMPRIC